MEAVTCSPFLVGKILDHLPMIDIYRCRLVSEVWYQEADRKINRNSIEKCSLSKKYNLERFAGRPGYLKGLLRFLGQDSYHPTLDNAIKAMRNFFDEMRCCPSFTFIASDASIFGNIIPTPIDHPAVMIKDVRFSQNPSACSEHLQRVSNSTNFALLEICLRAIHINRFASKHKIIITEWIPGKRVKLNSKDPEFPIQAFVFLACGTIDPISWLFEVYHAYSDFFESIPDALRSGAEVSGGAINRLRDQILFLDKGQEQWKPCNGICIAFAGKGVKSAVFNHLISHPFVFDEQDVDSRLEEFKRSLSFPTDDGNVLGFLFTTPDFDFPSRIWRIVSRKFPRIFLFKITVEFMINNRMGATLHLIRVSESGRVLKNDLYQ